LPPFKKMNKARLTNSFATWVWSRVARWFIFKPKIPVCVNFEGSSNVVMYILCPFDQFSGHLAYIMAIWYISSHLGTFSPVLVWCTKKNLATLRVVGQERSWATIRIPISFDIEADKFCFATKDSSAFFYYAWN
jgi:hypothetical protein